VTRYRDGVPRRSIVTLLASLTAGAVLVACSASTADFKKEGETYLESDEVTTVLQTRLLDAECEEPASTEVGTVYRCTANAADGTPWSFDVKITGERELYVFDGRPEG
jgi:hypothetical protein